MIVTSKAWMCASCQERYPMVGSTFCLYCARAATNRADDAARRLAKAALLVG